MRIIKLLNGGVMEAREAFSFRSFRLRTKLWMVLIPAVVFILVVTGYLTHWFSSRFLEEAVRRTVLLQTLGAAHEMEQFFDRCREDVLWLARGRLSRDEVERFLDAKRSIRGWTYAEAGVVFPGEGRGTVWRLAEGVLETVPTDHWAGVWDGVPAADPVKGATGSTEGGPWISRVVPAVAALGEATVVPGRITHVIRFIAPVGPWGGSGAGGPSPRGFVFLSVDARQVRDILSLFNSAQSPLSGYARSPELRYMYFVDPGGWILFQSEDQPRSPAPLGTDLARWNLSGTFGRPGLKSAFRPDSRHRDFWLMAGDLREGRHGVLIRRVEPHEKTQVDRVYLGYAPVRWHAEGKGGEDSVYGGVIFVDRSRLITRAGYRQVDVIFLIGIGSCFLLSAIVWGVSRLVTRPLHKLARAVDEIQESGRLQPLSIPEKDLETAFLKDAINNLIVRIREQMETIEARDRQLQETLMRERISLEQEAAVLHRERREMPEALSKLVGRSPAMIRLRDQVVRAASADADVLILGETGTGKQLAAEAIHGLGPRRDKPFLAINCGALDENLLMDALFGHVKGAFTEAKTDRKGAFAAAHGGTLFLDEVGTASPKVQKALLRAIAERRIRPLGSDVEQEVDVRLVAATNEDLQDLVRRGLFREDLYYRLNVITLRTPPLRERREDIPLLAAHFLDEACRRIKRPPVGLTQGALDALLAHDWPGNVRELENCLTRAVAMVEGSWIYASDLDLGGTGDVSADAGKPRETGEAASEAGGGACGSVAGPGTDGGDGLPPLNARQARALPSLLARGHMTRSEYQEAAGGIPARTALHDLRDLVEKGLVKKSGRGPATRYKVVNRKT